MEEMIGYCGYSCHLCAARSEDPAVRQKLVDGWRRIFGHQHYTAENVYCEGCGSDGKVADLQCQARSCARDKNLESCALCDEFPCKKVGHLLASRDGLLIFCRPKDGPVTREEFELCMRQFDSMPNIVQILAKHGKLPAWVQTRFGTSAQGGGDA
ncbi:DUF3795 domain-containing protein [bacterium]|nr:DUF3795 domain-containing protein [candidate division CSSED10-310 bacterium]